MSRKKMSIYDEEEFPDIVEVHLYPQINDVKIKLYAPREYCFIDVILDKDQEAIGSSFCSKCKKTVDPFFKFCPYYGAKSKGRRLLRKKEKIDDESENSPIPL